MKIVSTKWAALLPALALLFWSAGCSKASRQKRHTARGDAFYQKKEYAKAEVDYLNAMRFAPGDPLLHRKLATLYFEQGRSLATANILTEVLRVQPSDDTARQQLATTLFALQDLANARRHALIVVTNQPTNSAALLLVAETSTTSTQLVETAAVLNQVLQKSPGPGVHIAVASLNLRQGDLAAAEDQLKKASALSPPPPDIDFAWAKLRLLQTNMVEGEVLLKRAADASPLHAPLKVNWIDFEVARGNLAGARRSAAQITEKLPDYIPPWIRLANIAFIENRFDGCEKITQRVIGLDPHNHEALLLRARMWSAQGYFNKAIEELTRLEALLPNNPVVKFEIASAQARAGETSKALVLLNTVLTLEPRFASAMLLQAQLNLKSGNASAASTIAANLVKMRPDLREASLLLGSTYAAQNRLEDTIVIYRNATERFPKDPEFPTLLGLALLAKRDISAARTALEQSLKRAPNYLPATEQLVNLDIRATNFPAALSRAQALQTQVTNSAMGFILEAQVHRIANDFTAAESALAKALQREPTSPQALGVLADLAIQSGEIEKALGRLDDLTQHTTNAYVAWAQKAVIYESKGDMQKAIDAYQRAIAINQSYAVALNNLANLFARLPNRLDEAIALAKRATESAPHDPAVADTLGWLFFQKGDFIAARRILSDASDKLDHPEVHYHAAMADYAVGDENRARSRFTRALQQKGLPVPLREESQRRLAVLNAQPGDIETLQNALKRDDSDYLAQFKLAGAYQAVGSRDNAITAFKAAAKSNPQSAQPLLALARLQSGSDDKTAIEYARNARKLAPNDAPVAATLGALSVRVGDYANGYNLLLEAQRAGALSSPAEQFQFAIAQVAAGRTADALVTFNSLVANAPADTRQLARENIVLLTGEAAVKAPLAEMRLKANQNDIVARIASADLSVSQGDARKAADRYQEVLAAAPDCTPAHQRLAVLYIDFLDDEKKAYFHAMKAREAVPNDPQIARILGKIALERRNYADTLRFAQEASRGLNNDGEPYYLIGAAHLNLKRTNDARIALNKAATLPMSPETAAATKQLLSELK